MAQFVVLVVAENQREHVKDEQGSKKVYTAKKQLYTAKKQLYTAKKHMNSHPRP